MENAKSVAVLALLCLSACAATKAERSARELEVLRDWLSGSFSSRAQAQADPKNYFHIQLHMAPIWRHRADGPWLYVEQATASKPTAPYRQRVYRLRALPDGGAACDVYLLPEDPLVWAGAWKAPERFAALTAEQLLPRERCSVLLQRGGDDVFRGATLGQGCASELAGAAYATSEVEVRADRLMSWDRGFDAQGKQVWGAELGPYLFVKQEPVPQG